MGLNYYQKRRLVILPQAIRRILPPLGNQFVYMLKMSSLVSVIGLQNLTRRANELTVTVYRPLEIYSVLVVEYLVLILMASWMVRRLEQPVWLMVFLDTFFHLSVWSPFLHLKVLDRDPENGYPSVVASFSIILIEWIT